ncbi:Cof-type HAD-IIB family hydrolase [Bradyrhizobium sp. LHD-71]|uniref:Cof-type HAD-IIB family hydrolase n=1 Tax=Bradyrhizobium sp. LHD-71 TaxID=3072141 RepID=UPI00280D5941|nr:Cof-type HAD-IIB family hydrolase [Bradyrhizobium sp. LHD-71]MDQ8727571.1 Cof-type HAD-IIB family hydrolase [Bradyrhizobium sp. LHD-71]
MREKRKISLVIADVDGTLVTEQKVLTNRARTAIQALRRHGVRFAITSGRPPRGLAMLLGPLALDTPIAGFNGGIFVNSDMTVIEEHLLAPKTAHHAVDLIRAHGMDAWVYTSDQWLIRDREAPHVAREQWTVKFPPTVVDDFGVALQHAVKIVGVSDDLDRLARVEKEVQDVLGASASAARSQPYYLDVTHPMANKGTVVQALSKFLSIPPAEIATIGDQPNDVLMFRKSGFSIAMGNAGPDVKKQAHAVTGSYNDEGFAKAIEQFILNPTPAEVAR